MCYKCKGLCAVKCKSTDYTCGICSRFRRETEREYKIDVKCINCCENTKSESGDRSVIPITHDSGLTRGIEKKSV